MQLPDDSFSEDSYFLQGLWRTLFDLRQSTMTSHFYHSFHSRRNPHALLKLEQTRLFLEKYCRYSSNDKDK